MIRCFFLILLFISKFSLASQVLVVVDGQAITSFDFEKRVEALRIVNPSLEVTPSIQNVLLNNLVSEELFRNEARRLKISISEEEVKANFRALQLHYGFSDELLEKLLKNQSFYKQIESQALWNKLVGIVLANKVKVSEAEIRDEQKVSKAEIQEVTFKQVTLSNVPVQKIEALSSAASSCTKLDIMSMELGLNKPYTTTILYADLSPQLQNVVRNLPENKLSKAFSINNQDIALMICKKRVINNPQNPNEIRQELTNRKINAEAQKYLAELKKRIYIEYNH